MINTIRNLMHRGIFEKNIDKFRRIYFRRKYGDEYKAFLREISQNLDPDIQNIYKRLLAYGNDVFRDMRHITYPYEFINKYDDRQIKTYTDSDGHSYVLHNGKKLYGQFDWNEKVTARYYDGLILEQDDESPHKYLKAGRLPELGEVIADCGAAEGIFGLDVVEQASKLYLFECDPAWIGPLKKTFAPWKDKVEIVPKYIDAKTNDTSVCLDDFFAGKQLDYIKADIEGYECNMLDGGVQTFKNLKHSLLCLYHRADDEKDICNKLAEFGFKLDVNPNYMIILGDNNPQTCLRHAVVYAEK